LFSNFPLGGRTGYLLKSSAASQGSSSRQDVTDFMSLDIGAAFGFEIYLVKRLIVLQYELWQYL
jgi:hypothetical protein